MDKRLKSQSGKWPASRILRSAIGLLAALVGLIFVLLSLFVVPVPGASNSVEVSGALVSLSHPHPKYGDMGIVLDGGRSYHVNRADQVEYFAWQQMLSEVHPGDRVYLTVVTPLAWRLVGDGSPQHLPVAGIRTASAVYMDPAISADTWTAQAVFSNVAIISLLILVICLLPGFIRLFKRRPPLNAVGA
jgi:hypothetical protein